MAGMEGRTHGSRPAPLGRPRSAPAQRRAARLGLPLWLRWQLSAIVSARSRRQRPLQAAPHPRGPPGAAPSMPAAHSAAPAARPDPWLQGSVANRVRPLGFSEFQSPQNWVQNLGRENCCCLQQRVAHECLQKLSRTAQSSPHKQPARCWEGRAQSHGGITPVRGFLSSFFLLLSSKQVP